MPDCSKNFCYQYFRWNQANQKYIGFEKNHQAKHSVSAFNKVLPPLHSKDNKDDQDNQDDQHDQYDQYDQDDQDVEWQQLFS